MESESTRRQRSSSSAHHLNRFARTLARIVEWTITRTGVRTRRAWRTACKFWYYMGEIAGQSLPNRIARQWTSRSSNLSRLISGSRRLRARSIQFQRSKPSRNRRLPRRPSAWHPGSIRPPTLSCSPDVTTAVSAALRSPKASRSNQYWRRQVGVRAYRIGCSRSILHPTIPLLVSMFECSIA
jgi:hypothetical protein